MKKHKEVKLKDFLAIMGFALNTQYLKWTLDNIVITTEELSEHNEAMDYFVTEFNFRLEDTRFGPVLNCNIHLLTK